ncbi:MAG TPA: SOS response-associated peptidase [Casimicrobiaceae bacterium]|nr:SOS response-associated peptidase [Casimicrobiaceae bacterium]
MCGRYELSSHPAAIALAFGLDHPPDIRPRYNIAPMQQVPIVRVGADGRRQLVQVRWGLVPRFAKDPAIGARMINARGETLASRSAFRNAFARHRCLVPVNGFYEWQATPAGKQPLHIGMPDGRPFGLAGLYERWLSSDGDVLDTCAIITTAATGSVAGMHDRMPVIVHDGDYTRWLDPADADVADLVQGWSDPLRVYPVSTRVNAVRNDDAALVEPVLAAANDVTSSTSEAAPTYEEATDEDLAREPVQEELF